MKNSYSVVVLCDLIVDFGMRFDKFPINAGDIQRLSSLQLTSGGASNVAIMAARFGLSVSGLSEIGDDIFGKLLIEELENEGIDISKMEITVAGKTPVVGVLIDSQAEPAYLGISGSENLQTLPKLWKEKIKTSDAIYASGWAEYEGVAKLVVEGFKLANDNGVRTFFDLGPGNPAIKNDWIKDVVNHTEFLSFNVTEALKWSGANSIEQSVDYYLEQGVQLLLLKRGGEGCAVISENEWMELPGYSVDVVDKTGAGDSVSGSILYSVLNGWPLNDVGVLANITGGAKVKKLGTGRNLPTIKDIKEMMKEFKIGLSSRFPN